MAARRAVIIFDEHTSGHALEEVLRRESVDAVSLVPLTSKWQRVHAIEAACRRGIRASGTLATLNSAVLIDREVDALRERVAEWSAELGSSMVAGKTIREWFLLRAERVSTWWFSLAAEKNTLKTPGFFQIAQLQACDALLRQESYDLCIISHSNRRMRRGFHSVGQRYVAKVILSGSARTKPARGGRPRVAAAVKRLGRFLSGLGPAGAVVRAIGGLALICWRARVARSELRAVRRGRPDGHEKTVFVTYFAAVDPEAAARGIFRNRMAGPLQDVLPAGKTVWICLYVPYDHLSYRDAARLAARFTRRGQSIYLLEEFATVGRILLAVSRWLRQGAIYLWLRPRLRDGRLWRGLSIPESGAILDALLDESFLGWTGMAALLFLESFKAAFTRWRGAERCIYYLEMHEWEKALNAASRRYAPAMRTVGFQHTHITRNYFHYHCAAAEVESGSSDTGLPLPDVCACNGDIPMAHLRTWGLKNLRKVEAVRHLYLRPLMRGTENACGPAYKKNSVLLLVGTIHADETKGLVSFLHEAYPRGAHFPVWLKGHPSFPIGSALEELGIVLADHAGWEIREEPISTLLVASGTVLVGASAVAIEALAHACTVVVPVLPDCMFMSPLAGFEQYYVKAASPQDFRDTIMTLGSDSEPERRRELRSFVEEYWCLDESLQAWQELLA